MNDNSLVEQGIAAMKAGDKAKAREILQQAVEENPENAKAWYVLAGAQTDLAARRQALEKVLELKPDNQQAQEQLDKLNQQMDEDNVAEEDVQAASLMAETPTESEDDFKEKAEDAFEDVKERVSAMGSEGIDFTR